MFIWVDKAFKCWCKNYNLSEASRVYEKEASSNGNYKEYGNLTLYADYVDDGSMTVDRTYADYDLQGDWFSVYADSTQLTSPYGTYYSCSKSGNPTTLTVKLAIPADVDSVTAGEQKFFVNYSKIDCVVTDFAGNKKYSLSVPDTEPYTEFGYYNPTAPNSIDPIEVASCDVSAWNAGIYLFKFTATASPSSTEI